MKEFAIVLCPILVVGLLIGIPLARAIDRSDARHHAFEDLCLARSGHIEQAPLTRRWFCREADGEVGEVMP